VEFQPPLYAPGDILDVKGITHSDVVLYALLSGLFRTSGYAIVSDEYLSKRLGSTPRATRKFLQNLHDLGLIETEQQGNERKIFPVRIAKNPGTAEQIALIADEPAPKRKSFEREITELYKEYPRHEGKSKGVQKLSATIKTAEDMEEFRTAFYNYLEQCAGVEIQFIKHFSTFANSWRDYLEIKRHQSQPSTGFVKMEFVDGRLVPVSEE
jgi:hypothetical protein